MYKFFKKNNLQIFKFGVSGVIASYINYLVYISFYFISNNLVFASLCGYLIGILVSFILAKLWVFRNRLKQPIVKSFYLFCLIYLLGGIEMSLIIIVLNQLINNHKVAWLFGAFIGALNNYLGSKYITFRK